MSYLDDERRRYATPETAEERQQRLIEVELSFQTFYLAAYDRAAELKERILSSICGELTTLLESCSDYDPKRHSSMVETIRESVIELAESHMAAARENLAIVNKRLEQLRGF